MVLLDLLVRTSAVAVVCVAGGLWRDKGNGRLWKFWWRQKNIEHACQIIFKDCEWETDQEENCLESHSCWNWSSYLASLIYLFHYQLQFTMTSKISRVFHVCISSAEHCPIFINSWKCIWEADKWLCNGCNFTCVLWYGIWEYVSIR